MDNTTLHVSHGNFTHEVVVLSSSTILEVKQKLVEDTSLQPDEQRLIFRGRQLADEETLSSSGVKSGSKLMLMENQTARERREEAAAAAKLQAKAMAAIWVVKQDVDKYEQQVKSLSDSGSPVQDKDYVILSELLMRQLLKLDEIAAEGEAKQLRRSEVKRVQSLVDKVDGLRTGKRQAPKTGVQTPPGPDPSPDPNPGPDPDSIPKQGHSTPPSVPRPQVWNPGMLFTRRGGSPAQRTSSSTGGSPGDFSTPPGIRSEPEPESEPETPATLTSISDMRLTGEKEKKSPASLSGSPDQSVPALPRRKFSSRQTPSPSGSATSTPGDLPTHLITSKSLHSPSTPPKPASSLSRRRTMSVAIGGEMEASPLSPGSRSKGGTPVSPSVVDSISTFPSSAVPKPMSPSNQTPPNLRKSRHSPSPSSVSPSTAKSAEESKKVSSGSKPQVLAAQISKLAAEQRAAKSKSRMSRSNLSPAEGQADGKGVSPRGTASPVVKPRLVAKATTPPPQLDLMSFDSPTSNQGSPAVAQMLSLLSMEETGSGGVAPTASHNAAVAGTMRYASTNPFAVSDDDHDDGRSPAGRGVIISDRGQGGGVDPGWEKF